MKGKRREEKREAGGGIKGKMKVRRKGEVVMDVRSEARLEERKIWW